MCRRMARKDLGVDLDDLRTRPLAHVLHHQPHLDMRAAKLRTPLRLPRFQGAADKARVGQTMAEVEVGRDARGQSAVADPQALVIGHIPRSRKPFPPGCRSLRRHIAQRARPCRGQAAGGVDLSEQHRGHGRCSLLAAKVREQHRVHAAQPGEVLRAPDVQHHHNGPPRGGAHPRHELVLAAEEPQVRLVHALHLPEAVRAHHEDADVRHPGLRLRRGQQRLVGSGAPRLALASAPLGPRHRLLIGRQAPAAAAKQGHEEAPETLAAGDPCAQPQGAVAEARGDAREGALRGLAARAASAHAVEPGELQALLAQREVLPAAALEVGDLGAPAPQLLL
mmetsp:Transcript_35654/g.101618  ORF Transcript_35654/g.101618 Transcript_35654/m.101618 type:complete len:337 (-) Transcript_35654:1189-2199(-)